MPDPNCECVLFTCADRLQRMEARARFAQEKKTALLLRQGQRLVRHKVAVLFGNDEYVTPANNIVNPLFRERTHAWDASSGPEWGTPMLTASCRRARARGRRLQTGQDR